MSEIGEIPYVERTIEPSKLFYPFDPEYVIQGRPLQTYISLRANPIPPITTCIAASGGAGFHGLDITPFSPGEGYQIDKDDYDMAKRGAKLSEIEGEFDNPDFSSRYKKLPSDHQTMIFKATLYDTKFIRDGDGKIPKKLRELLKKLQFRVNFPNGLSYQSDLSTLPLGDEDTHQFVFFYPTEAGPFAKVPTRLGWMGYVQANGLPILLPDRKSAEQIQAKFIFNQKSP